MEEKSSGLFCVIVRFTNLEGDPLSGSDWSVEAMDEDPLVDDTLGESTLDASGEARIYFSVADVSSADSPGERNPDLYFILKHYRREVMRTPTRYNVNFEALDAVTGRPDQLTQDFGTFKVDIGR